jgi:hypothetical protein
MHPLLYYEAFAPVEMTWCELFMLALSLQKQSAVVTLSKKSP